MDALAVASKKRVPQDPSLAPAPAHSAWRRAAWRTLLGLLTLRLAYTALAPFDLSHDEAYYWDWSRQLDWGYYSKPPMVAWLIGLGTSTAGHSAFAVRWPAAVLSVAALGLVFLLAERMYGSRVGFWSMLLLALTPASAALGLLMTIDAPFLCFWCGGLYCLWRALEGGSRAALWWCGLAAALGLGLLTKQTTLAFFGLTAVFALASPGDRRQWRNPAFWLAACGALLCLIPVLEWNWRHDWITLRHTSEHFGGEATSGVRRLAWLGEFVGGSLGVLSPLTGGLLALVGVAAAWSCRKLERRELFLFCFSGLPLAGVLVLACAQRVELNWPAGFLPAGVILTTAVVAGAAGNAWAPKFDRRWLTRAANVGAASVVAAYAAPFVFGWLGLAGGKLDPVVRLRGWNAIGQAVGRQWQALPRPERTFLVSTDGRAAASELAFYLPRRPRAYVWNEQNLVGSQYDVWGPPRDKQGWDALLVTPPTGDVPPALAAAFERLTPLGVETVALGNGRAIAYRVWRGENFTWPRDAASAARMAGPFSADELQRR